MREEEEIGESGTAGSGGGAAEKSDALRRFTTTFVRFGKPLLVWVPLAYLAAFLPRAGTLQEGDAARAYYDAAESITQDRSMYEPLPPTGPHRVGNYYLYPPPLASLVAVLPPMRPGTFQTLILAANITALWVFAWALSRLARIPAQWGTPLAALLLMFLPGLMETIAIGNIDPIVFALVAIGLVLAPGPAAASLAAGAALKVTPAWPLGVLLVRLDRRAWLGAGVAASVCILVVVLAVGAGGLIDESLLWARRIAPTLSQGQFEVLPIVAGGEPRSGWMVNGNISPAFLPVRLLVDQPPPNVDIPLAARLYLSIVQFGVPALTVFLTRKRPPREQAAWVIAAATLAAPIMRGGYLPVLLVVPAILLGQRREAAAAAAPRDHAPARVPIA